MRFCDLCSNQQCVLGKGRVSGVEGERLSSALTVDTHHQHCEEAFNERREGGREQVRDANYEDGWKVLAFPEMMLMLRAW